jgi:hypothetical protein
MTIAVAARRRELSNQVSVCRSNSTAHPLESFCCQTNPVSSGGRVKFRRGNSLDGPGHQALPIGMAITKWCIGSHFPARNGRRRRES